MTTDDPTHAVPLFEHAAFVRNLARVLVRGDADLEDVVQETWVAALERGKGVRSPRAWLAAVVRRRAARQHRDRSRVERRHAELRPEAAVSTGDLAERHETIQRVAAALGALPEPYRDVLVLRYYEDLPPREVARRLGIPVETVRTRTRRGLERMRAALDEAHGGDRAAWAAPLAGLFAGGGAAVGAGVIAAVGLAALALVVAAWPRADRPEPVRVPADHAVVADGAAPSLEGRVSSAPGKSAAGDAANPASARPRIRVRVVDEADRPLAGIAILARFTGDDGRLESRPLGTSDEQGTAEVEPPERDGRMALITASHEEWHCGEVVRIPLGVDEPVVFRMVRLRALEGSVRTVHGAPSVGTRLALVYEDRSGVPGAPNHLTSFCEPTDEDGRFSFRIPPYVRHCRLWGILREGGRVEADLDLRDKPEIVLQPVHPATLSRITAIVEDAAGVAVDASVTVTGVDGGRVMSQGQSGADVTAYVSRPGRYVLTLEPEQRLDLGRPDPIEVTAPVEGLRIICPPGERVAGRLVGDDLEDFLVTWVRPRGADRQSRVEVSTKVGADGTFTLDGLRGGGARLYAHRHEDARYAVLADLGAPRQGIELVLAEGLEVGGRVVGYRGRNGYDLHVLLEGPGPTIWARVADDGTFVARGLPPGSSYALRYVRAGREGDTGSTVNAGDEDVEVLLPDDVLDLGLSVEGR